MSDLAPGTDPDPGTGTGARTGTATDPGTDPGTGAQTRAQTRAQAGTPADDVAVTRRTLAWLRERRGAGRARRLGYGVYVTAVLVAGWYGLYAVGAFVSVRRGAPLAGHAELLARVLPSGLVLLGLAALCVTAWDALWWGPVTPPRADADWLLALPVLRGPLLRPWFALSVCAWTLAALLLGFAGAMLLAAAGLAGIGALTLACLLPAACLGLLAVAGAVVVEGSRRAARLVQRWAPLAGLALLLVAAQAALAGAGHRQQVLEHVLLWSGPWGWAAQPVLAVTGRSVPLWQGAAALLVAAAGAALAYGIRRVPAVPAATLRARSRAASGVVAGLMAADLRAARLSAGGGAGGEGALDPTGTLAASGRAAGAGARAAARLRPPRSPALLVPWRDAVALLAAPRRLGLAVALLVCAGACALWAAEASGAGAFGATLVAVAAGCAAADRLLEPARLDADDVRRTAWSPRPPARVALDHAVLPSLVVAAAGVLLSLPVAALAHPAAPLVPLVTAPALVTSCLLSTYRPPVPIAVLFAGPALADFGPFFAVTWNVIGPLTGITTLTLAWSLPSLWVSLITTSALTTALLAWLRKRARGQRQG